MRIVIDTDPGIDDVVTLALAARSPELDLLAVTTTYGNATLDKTTRNAKALLELCGRRDIPVFAGSDRPLERALVTAPETHGESGVGYAPVPPAESVPANPGVLLDVLASHEEQLVLVTLGPLTNLAAALMEDRELVLSRVGRHIGMFGNLAERGNTNRFADFNAWCDPEATSLVLGSGLDTFMVGLDVTRRMVLTQHEVKGLHDSPDRLTSWLGAALQFYVEFHQGRERLDGCVVNDVLTVGELLRPGLLTFERMPLTVTLDSGEHRGHTKVDPEGAGTAVATMVDTDLMRNLLGRVFGEVLKVDSSDGKTRHG